MSTIVDEMSTKNLANALFPLTRLSILRELILSNGKSIHLRELARRTGLDARGVQREVRNLLDVGIIDEEKSGNQKLYRINEKCPVYPELKMLIIKTVGVADEIRKALEPLKNKIKMAFIYGSIAKGNEDSQSDIDLMLVGDVKLEVLFKALSDAHNKLKRVINPSTISVNEFKERLTDDEDFISRIWKDQKIILIGDEDEFTGMG
ncbi:MAG: nucleotidyltransferase domain-containing protein [bacterium]